MRCISSNEASQIDAKLLEEYSYTIEQLIEAAGLSIFHAIKPEIPITSNILVVCGPGNNGGDGLVLMRYLHNNGYLVDGLVPWAIKKTHLKKFHRQCIQFGVHFIESIGDKQYEYIIDAVYGFGFRPPLSEHANSILIAMMKSGRNLISIDIPSGWEIDEEIQPGKVAMYPNILISMTAPKMCAKNFAGVHLIIKDFVPRELLLFCGDVKSAIH